MKLDYFKQQNVDEEVISEINVTNLIDVTLILLIIFILIAPIMEQGISLTLPKATAEKIKSKEALTVEVDKFGRLFLDTQPVSFQDFQSHIHAIAENNPDQSVLIRADENNKYGDIVQILDMIKQSGITKVGILTRTKDIG
jgi:biopolymer transport protein ExbD